METFCIDTDQIEAYRLHLIEEEHCPATVEKYLRDIRAFFRFLPDPGEVSKEAILGYKQALSERYLASSANSMLVAVNRFLSFQGLERFRVRLFKVQRRVFREKEKELDRAEYRRLIEAAGTARNQRLCLLIQAICSTGIRVSEHRFITVEALRTGRVQVRSKGKERTIFLPPKLCRRLARYCRERKITAGPVFVTRTGKPMDRCNIWAQMKALCGAARIDPGKVFPHNLRHLFAVTYYQLEHDIVRLADILGHASIETTRIYTCTSGSEHLRILSRLQLLF